MIRSRRSCLHNNTTAVHPTDDEMRRDIFLAIPRTIACQVPTTKPDITQQQQYGLRAAIIEEVVALVVQQ